LPRALPSSWSILATVLTVRTMKEMLSSVCDNTTAACTRTIKSCSMTVCCKTAHPAHDPTRPTEFITMRMGTIMVETANTTPSGTTRELRLGVM